MTLIDSEHSSIDIETILDGLNDRQLTAVTANPCNQLIVAGAGSGKTRVLVHRIAWLIANGITSPHGVLAVTFTNKAAAEMRERVEKLLKLTSNSIWVGTFHSIANRILHIHHEEAGLNPNFEILDARDQERFVKRVMRELNLSEKQFPAKGAAAFINSQKENGRRAENVVPRDFYETTMHRVYERYEQTCKQASLVDFAELLLRSHELWLDHDDLLRHYQNRFEHILVDELQDTNSLQYAWIRVLAGEHSFVDAVGDDDQSIYGWRGADISNFLSFANDFDNTNVVRLEQNYRSTNTILRAANALISKNTQRVGKDLWTDRGEGEKIQVFEAYNEFEECDFIVSRIGEWLNENPSHSANDIAVLYRTNAQSRVVEQSLMKANIAYQVYGGVRFYDRMEIRNALGYMRLVHNRHADSAFERVVNVPPRGLGEQTVESVRRRAREKETSLWRATVDGLADGSFSGRAAAALSRFVELIDGIAAKSGSLPLDKIADHCIEDSGLIAHYRNEQSETAEGRVDNLRELVVDCQNFRRPARAVDDGVDQDPSSDLSDYLDQAALDSGDYQSAEGPRVKLMTMHSAKGLEFPLVFITGMERDLVPLRGSEESFEGREEERRLAYVAVTRAMRRLFLTYADTRSRYGKRVEARYPSEFLGEIPEDCKIEVRFKTLPIRSTPKRPSTVRPQQSRRPVQSQRYRIGQSVMHTTFGRGEVVEIDVRGSSSIRLGVKFHKRGVVRLNADIAPLQILD